MRDRGELFIEQADAAELSPGEFLHNVRTVVEDNKLKTVVVDSVNGDQVAMPQENALVLHMHELLQYLNRQGASTFLTVTQHGLVGDMKAPVDITYLADTVVVLHYFEALSRCGAPSPWSRSAPATTRTRSGNTVSASMDYRPASRCRTSSLILHLEGGQPIPEIRGHASAPGPFVTVTVTGAGIAPEVLSRILEPFLTTKEVGKGTGLGLSQVFGFSKQSGGDVSVDSRVGESTTIRLYLPRVAGQLSTRILHEVQEDAGGAGHRVLFVEGNIEVGQFASQILKDLGYVTTWAADGEDALVQLEPAEAFDIIFSDVVMPGMGGIELVKRVRKRWSGMPVVLASGYSHALSQEGTHGFELLHKP